MTIGGSTRLILGASLVLAAPVQSQQTLTVFAAASLTESFTELGKGFEAARPGVTVRFNFAGSQVLATQIEQGAKADVFASADQRWMGYAADKKLLAGEPSVFARNRLVVVIPKSNPGAVFKLQDLARPGLKLILAGQQVPVGAYSREALVRLSKAPGFPKDFVTYVLQNLVSEEENVKAVVAKVQLREADAGIAYATDVAPAIRSQLTVLVIPDPYNPVAEYPIALVAGGKQELAAEFVAYVQAAAGRQLLASLGFMAPTVAAATH
jgi:molybdate transport system substrate-binding protein